MPFGQRFITMAAAANFEFPTAVIEPQMPALAAEPVETPLAPKFPSATPPQDMGVIDPLLMSLNPFECFAKQTSVESTVTPEFEGPNHGDGSSSGEERQEPKTPPIMARKTRKSAKNPTAAMIENSRVRTIAAEKAAHRRADPRSPDEVYGTVGLVTEDTHPHTFSVQFTDPGFPMAADYMGVRSFQNCLENYIAGESPDKQRSSHRSAETLQRIKEMNPIPPPHYPRDDPQTCANWKHEIGYPIEGKQKQSPKWVIRDDKVYKFVDKRGTKVVEEFPECPTEEWYAILTRHHATFGHRGRDVVYNYVKSITPSISKGFVAAYVSNCCLQGKASRRKSSNEQTARAKEALVKTDKPSRGKKRVIDEVDSAAPAPAAKMPKAHSTEPAMVVAGDEQDEFLRQALINAMAGPSTVPNPANGGDANLQQFDEAFALGQEMYPDCNEEMSGNLAVGEWSPDLPLDSLADNECWNNSFFEDSIYFRQLGFD